MEPITYIDRKTGQKEEEKVYGQTVLKFLYGNSWINRVLGIPLMHLLSRIPFFSWYYGWMQTVSASRRKIMPFINKFEVDPKEFALEPEEYKSFNDFFIRHLKPEARPIAPGKNVAIIPADGRYLFHPNIHESEGFVVKGEKFNLATLLEDEELAHQYALGTMVMARLCPTDYHRFHFPCDCIPSKTKLINGWLYSVNPIAIKRDIHIFTQNKRTLTELQTEDFGKVLYMEIGATSVGLIHQTFTPGQFYPKGAEKGYFSFGASSLILFFLPGMLKLDRDLRNASTQGIEIKCLMGQSMGKALNEFLV